jgi:hypothetical protein
MDELFNFEITFSLRLAMPVIFDRYYGYELGSEEPDLAFM